MRLLLVEDDVALSDRLRLDLEKAGFAVDVAADGVGAEQVGGAAALLPERRDEHGVTILGVRRVRRDQRRQHGDDDEDGEDDETDDRTAVLGEIIPELGEAAGARGILGRSFDGGSVCQGRLLSA